jgi:large subunit ribosomal protein L29
MKLSELKNKTASELQEELYALLKQQFNLRMQRATNQLSATHQLKAVRRDIARVKTILSEQVGKTNE